MKKFKISVAALVTFAFFVIYIILQTISPLLALALFVILSGVLSWLLVEVCARVSEDEMKNPEEMDESELQIAIEVYKARIEDSQKCEQADHKIWVKLNDLLFEKRGHTRTPLFQQ